ncbi:cAMP-activated global transcriptional regulator CRP [Burkholderiales bacterium]|nr:cAMP-activated global transcriptional regulator CRP [Burkholderiales bacterium]
MAEGVRASINLSPSPTPTQSVPAPPIPQDPFAPLEEATLRAIAETGIVRTFPKNTVLIHEGDSGDALYIVLSGRVKVYASNAQGREFAIAFHGAGEYVGEMTLDGGVRSASVVTMEPTVCAVVHREQFREFILKNPDFALHLIEKLINRVRATTEDVKSLALTDVYGRLVRLLNALATPLGDGTSVVPERLTQQAIAERVGASRDMIGKLFKDLVAGGYLAIEDRTITILRKLPTGW